MPGYKRYRKSLKNNCVPLSSNVQDTRLKWVWSDICGHVYNEDTICLQILKHFIMC